MNHGWRSQGKWARAVTVTAGGLAVIMAVLAVCMAFPIPWDGVGEFGAMALFFPLHLLFFTLVAGALVLVARRLKARFAMWTSAFVVVLTAAMALTPVIAVWRKARELNVPLSPGEYLANAVHLNLGKPQRARSVVYGAAADGAKLELDVWRTGRPDTGPLRPAIVMIHGGAWCRGNRSMFPDWDRWLNGLGYEVFDVEYRMPPPVRWLDEIGDVKSALGWVAEHAAEYHVDPARISLMGASAGANLSMLAAYSMGDPQLPASTDVQPVRIRSVINFYGPTDMALFYHTCNSPGFIRPSMTQYIGGTPEEFPDRYRVLSLPGHIAAKAPPTLTLLGTSDRLVSVEQAEVLDEALAKAGVAHETIFLPGNDHAFDVNWGGFGTQIARAKIEEFLKRH